MTTSAISSLIQKSLLLLQYEWAENYTVVTEIICLTISPCAQVTLAQIQKLMPRESIQVYSHSIEEIN